jgi:hypothetical protein
MRRYHIMMIGMTLFRVYSETDPGLTGDHSGGPSWAKTAVTQEQVFQTAVPGNMVILFCIQDDADEAREKRR